MKPNFLKLNVLLISLLIIFNGCQSVNAPNDLNDSNISIKINGGFAGVNNSVFLNTQSREISGREWDTDFNFMIQKTQLDSIKLYFHNYSNYEKLYQGNCVDVFIYSLKIEKNSNIKQIVFDDCAVEENESLSQLSKGVGYILKIVNDYLKK